MSTVSIPELNKAVQIWLLETDNSLSDLAAIVGYWHKDQNGSRKPDVGRLRKALGLSPRLLPKEYVHEKTAVDIIRAINRDPREFGL